MAMYRKKPVVVEAWQWSPPAWGDMPEWLLDAIKAGTCWMTAQPGDWIIKGVKGEIYPCKPDIFAATYEPAETERLSDVDTSDIPETSEYWFRKAKLAGLSAEEARTMVDYLNSKKNDLAAIPPGARADEMQQAEIERLNTAIRLRDEQLDRAHKIIENLEVKISMQRVKLERLEDDPTSAALEAHTRS